MKDLNSDPHAGQPVFTAGTPLQQARAGMILLHGRDASAADILSLAVEFEAEQIAYLAPQAANLTWYPDRFLVPSLRNEPWLSSALQLVDRAIRQAGQADLQPEKLILLGFSQGACLALEYAARNARRYAGVVGLSGGLIGADDEVRNDSGDLAGTPIFLGCSNVDFHIPEYRVHCSAKVLSALGGEVETRIYPDMGHTVNADEISVVKALLVSLVEQAGS